MRAKSHLVRTSCLLAAWLPCLAVAAVDLSAKAQFAFERELSAGVAGPVPVADVSSASSASTTTVPVAATRPGPRRAARLIRAGRPAPKASVPTEEEALAHYRMASLTMPERLLDPLEIENQPLSKVAADGARLLAEAGDWTCVADSRTGLLWEVKTRDGRLRDGGHTYSWHHSLAHPDAGDEDGGRCRGGIDCDTESYVDAVNAMKLCGYSDWRLPTTSELWTILDFANMDDYDPQAIVDLDFFPGALASWYWSALEHEGDPGYAWYVLFSNGNALADLKARPKHIRLVRSEPLLGASD